ncbi:MAG: hypothetical protein EBR82_73260 [Caulobacteraceae bacterium]|nr:hypothetical protein [Caulobacteraceae bacterium]
MTNDETRDPAASLGSVAYIPAWRRDETKMDADELAIRSILSRCFSLGRRHKWSNRQFVDGIENKRAKINALIDWYREQAEQGRQTV